jgi:hypothetical protein
LYIRISVTKEEREKGERGERGERVREEMWRGRCCRMPSRTPSPF